jgi:hypothetical protein
MNDITHEPNITPAIRHDGWTGEAMAKFLETLAETGIVLEACDAASKSSTAAYALRRRNLLFAEGWETALGIARERLADTLLARSLEGNVEQIIKDGAIVAEKHFLDNRLGLAVLKRLDQRADGGQAVRHQPIPSRPVKEPNWDLALNALRTGEAEDIATALAMLKGPVLSWSKGDEVGEVCDPPLPAGPCQLCAAETGEAEFDEHCSFEDGEWWTDFPPPENFTGVEEGMWGDFRYRRHCTDEELVLLEADTRLAATESLAEAAAERDRWFAQLKAQLDADGAAPLVEEVRAALSSGS